MSSYPWSGANNANPYTDQNEHASVGIQPVDQSFSNSDFNPRITEEDADITVASPSGLIDAFETNPGDTIWLQKDIYSISQLDRRIDIPSGTTVAADGATLLQDEPKNGVLNLTNDNVRVTGLRFEGPQIGHVESYETTRAIMIRGNVEIDNCEVYGWPASGIYVGYGGEQTNPEEILTPHIHHNVVRDNQESSLGYGIVSYNGDPLIQYNFINNNRHGVSGGGSEWSSYRMRNNVHGEDGLIFQSEQHAPGGNRMEVTNNEFRMTEKNSGGTDVRAFAQRGTPQDVAIIERNHIFNPNEPGDQPDSGSDAAIVQYNHGSSDWVNVQFSNNQYGRDASIDNSVSIQPLSDAVFGGFEGETGTDGAVELSVPDGEYDISADHEDYETTAEGSVTVDGEDLETTVTFGSTGGQT